MRSTTQKQASCNAIYHNATVAVAKGVVIIGDHSVGSIRWMVDWELGCAVHAVCAVLDTSKKEYPISLKAEAFLKDVPIVRSHLG